FFLLLIASINYVNLSTARSLVRAREVSIRKVIGANRGQLFLQFIIETFLLFATAVLFALFIIYLTLPFYNDISGKQLSLALTEGTFWMVVGLAIAGTLLMSSIYPALLLASFKPLEALKGRITASLGTELLRKILVVFQFSIAIVLIIGTLV